MNFLFLLFFFLISFILNIFLIKKFIPILIRKKYLGIDQQKKEKPKIPTSGGTPTLISFIISTILIILILYFLKIPVNNSFLLASFSSIVIVAFVGILDDLNYSSEPIKNEYGDLQLRIGIPQWSKPLLSAFGALPLLLYSIGNPLITIPILNYSLNLGVLYWILLPILFIIISNSTNMLAGTNGLEGSLMFIICLALGIFTFLNQRYEASILAFIGVGLSLSYLIFNWYPAKILPGDSFTYLFGGFFAVITILGNVELFACFIFIPWAIEIILKIRGKLRVRSLGDIQEDGTLKMPYKKIYSWTHIMMYIPTLFNKRAKEWQVTLAIDLVCIFICILGFIIFL